MNKRIFIIHTLLFVLTFLCTVPVLKASHIVGGEITYVCLGGNRYKITVSIFRDCIGGIAGAISEDNPARIAIFKTNGDPVLTDSISGNNGNGTVIPPNFKNDCVTNPPATCLNRIVFERTYELDNSATGYKVVYQRCCRNGSILNIIDPSNTGATYSCTIPQSFSASCNNSAVFNNFPPQIICINNPLVYNHGATDPDGDSLSYEFCQAYDGGASSNPRPVPVFRADPLVYRGPYSAARPMGGNPRIQIDSKTGLITGTPNLQGRFVVSVCCHEWRRGVMINTTTREFQFVVTNCSKSVIADIPQYSSEFNTYIINCLNYSVYFVNTSKGGTTYFWDFGVEGLNTDTSSEFQPTYTYLDSGTYLVTQIINKGTTCSDSISRFVKVYPRLEVGYSVPTIACPGDTLTFNDNSTSTYPITYRSWNFNDFTALDTGVNPRHVFPFGGLYNVGLMVGNSKGCVDTIFKKILIDPYKPNIGRDTTIVKGESINFSVHNGSDFFWSPSRYLSDTTIVNPTGTFPDTGTFLYTLIAKSPQTNCVGKDSIIVRVISESFLAVPNAFSPNGDGVNDRFRALLVGYQQVSFFRIYNRYGQLVFESKGIEDSWDGTFNGRELELGVYYWLIGVKDRFGKDVEEKGDVTLLR